MVKSKYVSVTQMCNDKSNDDLLREAIENFCQQTPGSKKTPERKKWDRAFTKLWGLILKCQIPRTSLHPKYPDLLQEIQSEFAQRICTEFDPEKGKNLRHSLRLWMNYRKDNYGLGLTYRILDLYRQDRQNLQRETYLDAPIPGGNNDANIPTLGEVIAGITPDPMEILIQEEQEYLHEKLSAAIQKSDCHSKKHPQCTCAEIVRRNLFTSPPQNFAEIAEELNVPYQALKSHYNRRCKPLLKQIYNELFGG